MPPFVRHVAPAACSLASSRHFSDAIGCIIFLLFYRATTIVSALLANYRYHDCRRFYQLCGHVKMAAPRMHARRRMRHTITRGLRYLSLDDYRQAPAATQQLAFTCFQNTPRYTHYVSRAFRAHRWLLNFAISARLTFRRACSPAATHRRRATLRKQPSPTSPDIELSGASLLPHFAILMIFRARTLMPRDVY